MTIPSDEVKVDSISPSRPAATTFVNIFFLKNFEANMTKCFNFMVILKKSTKRIFICLQGKKYSVKLFLNHTMFSLHKKTADLHRQIFFFFGIFLGGLSFICSVLIIGCRMYRVYHLFWTE